MELPYPPTVNHYYGQARNGKKFIKPKGKKFRLDVQEIVAQKQAKTMEGRVSVFIAIYPPDKRKRDIDNVLKALLDALTKAGVWDDDEQIDVLEIRRNTNVKGGLVKIVISEEKI